MFGYTRNKKKQSKATHPSRLSLLLNRKNKTLFYIQLVCIIAAIVLVGFLVMYWVGNGFSTGDNIVGENGAFYLHIDTPTSGSQFSQGNTIYIRGGSLGGSLSKAIVWDTQYNVGAPCSVSLTQFSYAIFPNHVSVGKHTLAVQAQNVNGEWSQISYVEFEVKSGGLIEPNFPSTPPSTIPNLFQPIIDIWNGITGHTEQGQGDNDWNGDNVDDRLQSSPTTPRYNPFNLPVTLIIIVILILIIIIVIAVLTMRYLKQRNAYKAEMAKYIAASPERRDWYLRLKTITARSQKRTSVRDKLGSLKRREQVILEKKQQVNKPTFQPRPLFRFGTFGKSVQNKFAILSSKENRIKKAHQAMLQDSQLQQELANVRRNMRIVELENNKLALQNKMSSYRRTAPRDDRGLRFFAKKIAQIEANQKHIDAEYKAQLNYERSRRAQERDRFSQILTDLNSEKKRISQEKSVKILIVPKSSPRPRVPYIPQQRTASQRQFVNRGMMYGRSKKKKARKVSL